MATDDDLAKCCMLNLTTQERCNLRTRGTHLPFVRLRVVYLVGPVQPLDTIYWGIVPQIEETIPSGTICMDVCYCLLYSTIIISSSQ
jgi:hypothetical protein